jgi:RimJ/RimL family protein N-acetyltransferase
MLARTHSMDNRDILNPRLSIWSSTPADRPTLIAGRDVESRRFLDDGDPEPNPAFCILVSGEIVGWVDFDNDRTWLLPDEVNIGYNVFPSHRANGYASSAVRLLFNHLAANTENTVATLLINPANEASIRVARRLDCQRQPDLDGNAYFKMELQR